MSEIKINDFIDMNLLNQSMIDNNIPIEHKIKEMHKLAGGQFYSENIISNPTVSVCGIGGFPIVNKNGTTMIYGSELKKESLLDALYEMSGASSFMSFLNPTGLPLNDLGNKVVNKYQHLSVLHTMTLNILITGISIGVEHEFSSQRDIVHLSRITVAKTKAQSDPCLVLPNEKYVNIYEDVLKSTKKSISNNFLKDTELQNLLFPTAKASALIISGSVRNILKLIDLKNSGGKEDELIRVLNELNSVIKRVLF